MERTLYDADHDAFREAVREFTTRTLVPRREEFAEATRIDREVWLEAGRQGFLGLGVPEDFGGSGAGDFRYQAVLGEETARVAMAYSTCIGIHTDIVAPYLVELGTDEQKKRWLADYSAGVLLGAIGMTEPSGGSDLKALRTTARRDGDSWVVNGSKTFITNGGSADLVVTAVRTDPEKGAHGISLLVIEADTPGFRRGRVLHKVGQAESDTSELFFEDCRVPAENLLGQEGRGFVHMMELLPQERLSVSITNLAHAQQIMEETLEYVRTREAFGRPVGTFQANAHLVADLVTRLDVTQHFLDACVLAHTRGRLSAVDAAKAKLWTSEVQNQVLDACVQLYGGYGYMQEYRVARAWADGRVSRIWAGSNEIMRQIVARDLQLT